MNLTLPRCGNPHIRCCSWLPQCLYRDSSHFVLLAQCHGNSWLAHFCAKVGAHAACIAILIFILTPLIDWCGTSRRPRRSRLERKT